MAPDYRASRGSGGWRLSNILRPIVTSPDSCPHCGRDSLDEGFVADWTTQSPSIQPRSPSRTGGISPTIGLSSPTFGEFHTRTFSNESNPARNNSHITGPGNDGMLAPGLLTPHSSKPTSADDYSQHGRNMSMESTAQPGPAEDDKRSVESNVSYHRDDAEEADLGLVSSRPSHHPSNRLPSRGLSEKLSNHRLSNRLSTHLITRSHSHRDSHLLEALPSVPAGQKSGEYEKFSFDKDVEKSIMTPQAVQIGQPGPPTGPPGGAPLDPNVVVWNGPGDPGNPMNWPRSKKWACTFALGFMTFSVTFASSVFSPGTSVVADHFGVSDEVVVLGTALFVLGFAFGPIVWGPFSELYGRKTPLFVGYFIFGIFQIPVAVAQNVETIMICRFLAGIFGCAPLAIVGGAMADFWPPAERGVAVAIFSGATFLGPTGGPIVGGFLVQNPDLGWRWTSWITMILTFFFGIVGFFAYPESFPPVLLQRRAKKMRYATRNWALHALADENKVDVKQIASKYLTRPFVMLFQEPILLLITIYISFIYGILYLTFEAYPISFIEQRGWTVGVGALPFVAVMIGVLMGGFVIYKTNGRYVRIMKEKGRPIPEERLIPMMIGATALPAGLFMWAWTSSPNINPWPQIIAGAPVGMGILLIFLQGLNYIIDVYMMNANSAIAGNTFVRSWLGAGFPMFATAMYRNLGVQWATTMLAFIAVALWPVPILFYIYGARIRKMSRFVPQFPPGMGPPGMGPPPGMGGPPGVGGSLGMKPPAGAGNAPAGLSGGPMTGPR